MMAPPEQRAEGKLVIPEEMLGKVQILVREVLQLIPLHKLGSRRVKVLRGQKSGAGELSLQPEVQEIERLPDLFHDAGLRPEKLLIGHETDFIRCEEERRVHEWFGLGGQSRKTKQRKGADQVRNRAGVQQRSKRAIPCAACVPRTLLLVHELVGEDQDGKSQTDDPAGARPRILTAHQKIGGEKAAAEQDDGDDDQPGAFRKPRVAQRRGTARNEARYW